MKMEVMRSSLARSLLQRERELAAAAVAAVIVAFVGSFAAELDAAIFVCSWQVVVAETECDSARSAVCDVVSAWSCPRSTGR